MKCQINWLLMVLIAGAMCGCHRTASAPVEPAKAEPAESEPAVAENKKSSPTRPTSDLGTWTDVEKYIASQQGKVVVVDVWSTWCAPCLREFPKLVELHRRYEPQISAVSVNINFTGAESEKPSDAQSAADAVLESQAAAFRHFVSTTPDEEMLASLGAAAIPIVRVYDKQGKLRKQFTNDDAEYGEEGFTYADHIEPLVKQLLAE